MAHPERKWLDYSVEVLPSFCESQADETSDGVKNTMIHPILFQILHMWHILKNIGCLHHFHLLTCVLYKQVPRGRGVLI